MADDDNSPEPPIAESGASEAAEAAAAVEAPVAAEGGAPCQALVLAEDAEPPKDPPMPPVSLEEFEGLREPTQWENLRGNPFFWLTLAFAAAQALSVLDGVIDLAARLVSLL